MAITKLLRIKENKYSNNKSSGLHRCLNYILNPDKTDDRRFVTGNCGSNPDFIYSEMCANKKAWGKEIGSQGFHYVISFDPSDDVPPDLSLQVANDFCHELLGDQYIYVIARHVDTAVPHCHIVFDSVNYKTGRMYHSGQYDWLARIQPITDNVCERYGLKTLSFDLDKEKSGMHHGEWENAKQQQGIKKDVRWSDIIRDDIDECISQSKDWDDFLSRMQSSHYFIRDGKYLSLRPEGKDRAIRTARLGNEYTKESLQHRLGIQRSPINDGRPYKTYGNPIPVYRSALTYINKGDSYSPIQRQWFKKMMRLRHFRHTGFRSGYRYKKDVVRLGKITDQMEYLFRYDITSLEDITSRLEALAKHRGKDAADERRMLRGIMDEYRLNKLPADILYANDAPDFPLPNKQAIYQIRINNILFGNDTDLSKETFTVRIPESETYARLYSDDSRIYNNGNTISTYIYKEAEYQIESASGEIIGKTTGECLKEKFKSKVITKETVVQTTPLQEEPQWKKK